MGLNKLREFLESRGQEYIYAEEDGCGSVDFEHRGLRYHIWEFPGDESGAESNVRNVGRMETFGPGYEKEIIEVIKNWR